MTPEQLAADRAVCNAATPGPWEIKFDRFSSGSKWRRLYVPLPGHGSMPLASLEECGSHIPEVQREHDADFLAAARTRWPAALDRIEQLEKENVALREQVAGHAERIAAQSELLSRRVEK